MGKPEIVFTRIDSTHFVKDRFIGFLFLLIVGTVVLSFFFTFEDMEAFFKRDNATEKVTPRAKEIPTDEKVSEVKEVMEVKVESNEPFVPESIPHFADPTHLPDQQVVRHYAISLQYNEYYEQASWVAYRLSSRHLNGKYARTNNFTLDPKVSSKSAGDNDYRRSGYDRGHLAPAADMKSSKKAMDQCFYMSNISPQKRDFNGGVWLELEELIRDWTRDEKVLYIVTGPVLPKGLKRIGKNKVGVPKHFYKVILDVEEPEFKAIGFLMKNRGTSKNPKYFAVSVDSVEKFTGLNFFPALPDSIEWRIESRMNKKDWDF